MELSEAIEAIEDASSGEYLKRIDAVEYTNWQDVAFTIYAANSELLEALEYAVNWGHGFEGTGTRPEWLTEAEEAIRKHKGE